ncbi:helix-turn-helix domain-containing protein [Paenibacillus sp. GCM10023252]|uniref:AraC family transcriptional regulator n=1 Tax=Paenibacillus sp. GCM10023252 TaxID=3252649 RepID=UPI00360F90A0
MMKQVYQFRYQTPLQGAVEVEYFGWSEVRDRSYRWNGNERKERSVVFQYTTAGSGVLDSGDGHSYVLSAGKGFFAEFPGNHLYYFDPKASNCWEFVWLQLSGDPVFPLWKKLMSQFGPITELSQESLIIRKLLHMYARIGEEGAFNRYALSAFAYDWMMTALAAGRQDGAVPDSCQLERVFAYIDLHYAQPLTLKELADQAELTPNYFCQLFHERVGLTPIAYLQKRRVEEAVRLLRHTKLSVSKIAAQTGFDSSSYFGKVFRKHLNCSPQHYRAEMHSAYWGQVVLLP